jgi:hypothetical protein
VIGHDDEEVDMTNQPNSPLAAGVAASVAGPDADDDSRATDDGQPVGAADARADAERTGAGDDDGDLTNHPVDAALPARDAVSTDDGVPVGSADADADRRRSGADDAG